MRPDNCTVGDYRAWFQGECDSIATEPGSSVVFEFLSVNAPSPPWTSDLAIIFPDKMYIRVYEHYRELAKAFGGGGRLQYFSYHYGPCSEDQDSGGFPERLDECVLRIDVDWKSNRHAHYDGEDHIPENRLIGLDFDAITPFHFIRAVLEHRKTKRPLPEILGFKVAATI